MKEPITKDKIIHNGAIGGILGSALYNLIFRILERWLT